MGRKSSSSTSTSSSSTSSSSSSSSSEEEYDRKTKKSKQIKDGSEKKPKRMGIREAKKKRKEELQMLSKEIFSMFLKRKMLTNGLSEEESERKAERRWKKLSHEMKVVYEQLAFIESTLLSDSVTIKKKRKADTSRRKEEWHPYLLFCKMKRESVVNDGVTGNAVMKRLSYMWKELPEKEKERYVDMAKENKRKDCEKERQENAMLLSTHGGHLNENLTIPLVSAVPMNLEVVQEINLNETMPLNVPDNLHIPPPM